MALDGRCPEPKPVFIALLSVAGAGAFGSVSLTNSLLEGWSEEILLSALRGWSISGLSTGLAIGVSFGICSRLVYRLAISVLFGTLSNLATDLFVWQSILHEQIRFSEAQIVAAITLVGPLSFGMALAHSITLRVELRLKALIALAAFYPIVGSISLIIFTLHMTRQMTEIHPSIWVFPLLLGAAFGVGQFLAVLAALALDRRDRLCRMTAVQ